MALKDDLVLLFDQDGRELVNNAAATSTTGTATQTQTVAGASRTVRGFGSPYGVGTTDRIASASNADLSAGPQSVLAWIYIDSAGSGTTYGRIYQKGIGLQYHDALLMNNAATSVNAIRKTATGGQSMGIPVSSGGWRLVGYTSDGATNGANPAGVIGYVNGAPVTLVGNSIDVSTAFANASAYYDIGNRSDGTRCFDGMLYQIAFFPRVLTAAEVADLYANWGQLSGGAELAGNAQASASASANLTTGSAGIEGAAQASATATGDLSTSIPLAGVATANAAASGDLAAITITNPTDGGSVVPASCTVAPNGITPTITLVNRASAWGFVSCHMSGVLGLRPIIEFSRTGFYDASTYPKFVYSYTGEIGTWLPFDTTQTLATPYIWRSQNNAAFTQDGVYVAFARPWLIAYTLPWIQSLEPTGFVGYAPSGGGVSYQFETRTATTNGTTSGTGDVIPAQPLYSFKVGNGAANAPDGLPKRKMVLMSGVHCNEPIGNYVLKGAVEFLASSDPKAVLVRSWFDVFVYPIVASAGRAGCGVRNDFDSSGWTNDINRSWQYAGIQTVDKHKAAILADTGNAVDVWLDFHGAYSDNGFFAFFQGVSGDVYGAKWSAAINAYTTCPLTYSSALNWSMSYARNTLGTEYAAVVEAGSNNYWTQESREAYGANNIKAVADLIAAGEWGTVPLVAAASSTASAAATLTTGIPLAGAAVGTSTAAGDLTAQVSLSGEALAQATAAANLTAGVGGLSGDASAQSAAAASLTTDIHLAGAAVAQAAASGTLAGGIVPMRPIVTANRFSGLVTARLQ